LRYPAAESAVLVVRILSTKRTWDWERSLRSHPFGCTMGRTFRACINPT